MSAPTRRRLANAVLAVRTSLRHLRDDPVTFALQLGQRFPGQVARPASHALDLVPSPTARAWAAWMRGDRAEAAARLEAAGTAAPGRGRFAAGRAHTPPPAPQRDHAGAPPHGLAAR
ncbi:MAG: hypothetical protein ACTH31_09030 [Pseudoclavibacter sp.]